MHHAFALLLASTVGVDVGWQPTRDGGFEYIIQIEPEALESLLDGQEIISDIPPFLRGVRSYRIRVGTEPLPQEGVPPEIEPLESNVPESPSPGPAAAPAAGVNQPTPASPASASPTPAQPTSADPDPSFNERVAPDTPEDRADNFNERIAPEPVPEDDIPDSRAAVRNDGPTLLESGEGNENDDEEEPSTGDRYNNLRDRYEDRGDEDLLESGDDASNDTDSTLSIADSEIDSELGERPAISPPDRADEGTTRPDPFLADSDTKPLINRAGYREDEDGDGPSGTNSESGSLFDRARSRAADATEREADSMERSTPAARRSQKSAEKPWAPFTLAMLGLFASMGGNCYLGWLGWGFRERYLRLLDERKFMRGRKAARTEEDADVEAVPDDYDA